MRERIRRPDFGHLEIEVTVDDMKAYTKAWTVRLKQAIVLDTELVDEICLENEKSVQRMTGSSIPLMILHVNSTTPVMIVRSAVSCTAWRLSSNVSRFVIDFVSTVPFPINFT